jgi:nucleotide-binding universal stress UspA family protein
VSLLRRRPKGSIAEVYGRPRVLVPFVGAALEGPVLDAALRIARAEEAVIVPAYIVVVPLEFELDAPLRAEVDIAMPLLEAVEVAATRAKVPVDARIERGRTPVDALRKLWEAESFDRIIVPAPPPDRPGFSAKDLTWILTHSPAETIILRPHPNGGDSANGRPASIPA